MLCTATQAEVNPGWSIHTPHLVSSNRTFGSWDSNTSFGALSRETQRDLESTMSIVECNPGDILFLEQEPLSRVCIVLHGDVRLSLQDIGGRRLTFRIAKRGAVLGAHSALFGSLSEWSADILYPSKIGLIIRDDFLYFAKRHPEIYGLASKELISALTCAFATLRIVGLSSCVGKRVAAQLLAWGERGNKTGDQTQFRMALTHAQIAEYVGAVRETVTRALTTLKQRGLVEIRGCMLKIPSTAALRRYAGGS